MTNTNTLSMQNSFASLITSLFYGNNLDMASYNENVKKIAINNFVLNNKEYIFKKEIILNIEFVDNMYYTYDDTFDIYVYTENLGDVEKEYAKDFAELYQEYALEEDINLDKNARILKRKFLDYCMVQ